MKKFIGLLLILCLFNFLSGLGGGGADTDEFPDIYIDEGVGGTHVGSIANPYDDFADINWTTGGDNSIFDWYAGAEDASVTINLMEGDEWREELIVGTSGSAAYPIIIRSYGSGAVPIINATNITTGWVADAAWATTWEKVVDTDISVDSDYNYRNILAAGSLSTSGTQVRITLTGHSAIAGQVDGASIGERDPGTDDMANALNGTFKRLLFGTNDWGTIPAAGTLVSDALVFDLDEAKDYLVHEWFDDNHLDCKWGGAGDGRYISGADTGVDGTEVQVVAYNLQAGQNAGGLSKVEVLAGVANVWVKAGITSQPYIVIFDGQIGTYQTAKGNLSSEYDWFWDTGPDELYVYAPGDPDTEYTIVEIGTRERCIQFTGDIDYVTVQDLKLYGARTATIGNFDDCDYITIKDSELVAAGRFAIICTEATYLLFQNLHIHDITVEEAFYLDADSENGTNNVTIENCDIHDIAENGIYLGTSTADGLQDIIIRHNAIYDIVDTWNTGSLSAGGGGDGYGIQGQNGDGLEIYYNYTSETDRGGIQLNLIDNTDIYNNVIYGSATHGCLDIVAGDVYNIKNNIIQTDSNNIPLVKIRAGVTNVTISNNRYYTTGNGTDAFNWLGANHTYANFANWVVASGDANSSTGDPLMIDPANNDFRLLMASLCINAGVDVGLTRDYRGRSIRHAPDIGAYEDPTSAIFMAKLFKYLKETK